jgi:hypothetical protein
MADFISTGRYALNLDNADLITNNKVFYSDGKEGYITDETEREVHKIIRARHTSPREEELLKEIERLTCSSEEYKRRWYEMQKAYRDYRSECNARFEELEQHETK